MDDGRRRLDDLLFERATAGLEATEAAELERLLAEHPYVERDTYERAAAAVCLGSIDASEPLPPSLRSKLDAAAAMFLANAPGSGR